MQITKVALQCAVSILQVTNHNVEVTGNGTASTSTIYVNMNSPSTIPVDDVDWPVVYGYSGMPLNIDSSVTASVFLQEVDGRFYLKVSGMYAYQRRLDSNTSVYFDARPNYTVVTSDGALVQDCQAPPPPPTPPSPPPSPYVPAVCPQDQSNDMCDDWSIEGTNQSFGTSGWSDDAYTYRGMLYDQLLYTYDTVNYVPGGRNDPNKDPRRSQTAWGLIPSFDTQSFFRQNGLCDDVPIGTTGANAPPSGNPIGNYRIWVHLRQPIVVDRPDGNDYTRTTGMGYTSYVPCAFGYDCTDCGARGGVNPATPVTGRRLDEEVPSLPAKRLPMPHHGERFVSFVNWLHDGLKNGTLSDMQFPPLYHALVDLWGTWGDKNYSEAFNKRLDYYVQLERRRRLDLLHEMRVE